MAILVSHTSFSVKCHALAHTRSCALLAGRAWACLRDAFVHFTAVLINGKQIDTRTATVGWEVQGVATAILALCKVSKFVCQSITCAHTHRDRERQRHAHSFELLPPRKSFPSCIVRYVVCSEVRLCLYLFLSVCVCVYCTLSALSPFHLCLLFRIQLLVFWAAWQRFNTLLQNSSSCNCDTSPRLLYPLPSVPSFFVWHLHTHTLAHIISLSVSQSVFAALACILQVCCTNCVLWKFN